MILSAMIFAGLTLIIGFGLGFLLGQARRRMSYEERLHDAEAARSTLAGQVADLQQGLRAPSAAPPAAAKADSPAAIRE